MGRGQVGGWRMMLWGQVRDLEGVAGETESGRDFAQGI